MTLATKHLPKQEKKKQILLNENEKYLARFSLSLSQSSMSETPLIGNDKHSEQIILLCKQALAHYKISQEDS